MNHNNKEIIITDERIINFYEKNKQIDIVKLNLLYIELFEDISDFKKKKVVDTIINQTFKDSKTDINKNFKSDISNIDYNLYNFLSDELPTADIINTNKSDLIIKRKNKQDILIETKNYSYNVKNDDVEQFIINVNNHDGHGIFISQNSGIVNKDNFQFEINNNKIFIYIHKMKEPYTICLAIKLIDLLSEKYTNIGNDNIVIPKDILKEINNEYQNLYLLKDKLITDLKDYTKKTLERYETISVPSLDNFLSLYYANIKKTIYICEYCNNYKCEKLLSMARHKTSCKLKITDKQINNKSKNI